jgi:UDP-N-acetylmuramyl pentapeptide phosphotransferase/UDP-N-acetylglucosamine-1-phosphate transferase
MPMPITEGGFFVIVAVSSSVLVGIVRRVAVARGVIDHPSHRGSHTSPTPRGGGLGAMAAVAAAFVFLAVRTTDAAVMTAVVAGLMVATIGWLDDHRSLSVRSRLAVHLIGGIAVAALWLQSSTLSLPLRIALAVWWAFWTMSSINLVNFMDGINGLVASQIAIFAASLMLFGWEDTQSSWYAAAAAAACLGFLPWNYPRARIFLGDVGSGALGYLVPFLALLAMRETGVDVVRAHLPLLPLFGDATVTIARRWRLGEKLTEPHRSHLYQRMANGGIGHTKVTAIYGAASTCGAIVAHAITFPSGWPLVAGYTAGVALLGIYLERGIASRFASLT